jgi:hypothetical protein
LGERRVWATNDAGRERIALRGSGRPDRGGDLLVGGDLGGFLEL